MVALTAWQAINAPRRAAAGAHPASGALAIALKSLTALGVGERRGGRRAAVDGIAELRKEALETGGRDGAETGFSSLGARGPPPHDV
jgi:hypothetical protein